MTTARTVPVTTEMDGDELDALDAWHLARHHGLRKVAVESFVRFRYGDGFTNSRALALQACLAVVPFLLALTGLASDLDEEREGAGRARRQPHLRHPPGPQGPRQVRPRGRPDRGPRAARRHRVLDD